MYFAKSCTRQIAGLLRRLVLLLCVFAGAVLQAAELHTSLTRDSTTIGNPVRLEVTVNGGRADDPPHTIDVDGLDISYMGPTHSNQFVIQNGRVQSIVKSTYNYRVTPKREGTFRIPALAFRVDGEQLQTQPVALRVEKQRPGNAGGGQGQQGFNNISFAEIILPKKSAYVGETLPVEIRLYVDSRITWQPETMPELQGEGFTKTKMPEPRGERGRRDGREYDVLVFRTAITPSRAGTVKVGPSQLDFNARIPRAQPNRRSPLDDFFGEDFFNDPFFGGFGAVERRKAIAEGVDLEVKPLPAAGRPASFSGAVGKFALHAEGSPKELNVGDPLTMTLTVSGRGNFDRVNAPVMKDTAGWRSYPPTSNFQPEDDVSYRGTKTFQVAVIPEARKTQMPQFEFSYFDPESGQYVTLTSEAAPLVVKGEPLKPKEPVRKSAPEVAKAARPDQPPVEEKPNDILGLRYDQGVSRSFIPLYRQTWFWAVQSLPLLALIGFAGVQQWKRNAGARRTAALRRRKNEQVALLQREQSRPEFLEAAARAIQFDTALATGQDPATVDATEACRSRPLDPTTEAAIEELFQARAELLYAGVAQGASHIDPAERERFVTAVANFEKSHGRN